MLTVIGLGLDVVGAGVLAIGLFRPSQPLLPGWSRDPVEAVSDYASGITGFGFLATGFLLQGIAALSVGNPPAVLCGLLVGTLTLVIGTAAASITFEYARAKLLPGEKARAGQSYPRHYEFHPHWGRIRGRRVPRLWQLTPD
jgi:hypothetical protein